MSEVPLQRYSRGLDCRQSWGFGCKLSWGLVCACKLYAHGSHDVGVRFSGQIRVPFDSGYRGTSFIRNVSHKKQGVFEL